MKEQMKDQIKEYMKTNREEWKELGCSRKKMKII